MKVSVQGSVKDVVKDLGVKLPRIQKAATVTALNKTSAKILTQTRRDIAKEVGIPQKLIKRQTKKYNANYRKVEASVFFGLRKKIPLKKVVRGGKGAGKYSQYLKGTLHGRSVDEIFEATMPTGHVGLFVRKPEAEGKIRLPIQEVALDLSEVGGKILKSTGNRIGEKEFERQFIHDLKRRLKRRR